MYLNNIFYRNAIQILWKNKWIIILKHYIQSKIKGVDKVV